MNTAEVHQYLERFFTANGCEIKESGEGHLSVQLTAEMDKELMNRPFYWSYLEKTGGVPNPMAVTFITDPEKAPEGLKGERIHFGAPRLHQFFRTARKRAAHIRLYESPAGRADEKSQVPLHPWLAVNVKISYICDLKRDVLLSLGLNLLTGAMIEGFHSAARNLALTPKLPDFCFTISPIIRPASGMIRLRNYLTERVSREDRGWADEAVARWNEDIELLNHFYSDTGGEPRPLSYENELAGLKDQYEPVIQIEVLNGGIYYLASGAGALIH